MADCGKLKKGVAAPCDPAVGGLQTKLVLVRFDDILSVVADTTNPKLKVVTLKSGVKGFLFEGLGDSNSATAKLVQGKYSKVYTHEVSLVSFGIGPEDTATVEDLAKDKVVAFVPDNNGFFKIYGLNGGLSATKADTDTGSTDTGGAPEITLTSTKEKGLADFFAKMDTTGSTPVYDPAGTKTAFEALYA